MCRVHAFIITRAVVFVLKTCITVLLEGALVNCMTKDAKYLCIMETSTVYKQ